MQPLVMIVEDEASHRRTLEIFVTERLKMRAFCVSSGQEAVDAMLAGAVPGVDMMLLDWHMPGMRGNEVLEHIRPQFPNLPIIIITASEDVGTAVQAMKSGADDFVTKPFSPDRLQVSIDNLLKIRRAGEEISRLKRTHDGTTSWGDLVGQSQTFIAAKDVGHKAADSAIPVLLLGESGVGKELFARAIHGSGERAGKPFVAVNCGAIPENLVESILFGHEKGAFTGAISSVPGKFREADGGTLFLDEVGEIKPDMQVKLLRALQQKEVQSVGGKNPVKVDVRVISATNQKLEKMVASGTFREDLFYRLNVFPISIPPLRTRKGDVAIIASRLAASISARENKNINGIKPEALDFLESQPWPGNVRQLENTIFRAVVMNSSGWLEKADFAFMLSVEPIPASAQNQQVSSNMVGITGDNGELRSYDEIEKDVLNKAVEICGGNLANAAKKLGVGRSTMYRKLGV